MSNILNNLGKNLKKYRLLKGYTQEQFAEKANMSVTFLSLLESGNNNTTLVKVEMLANLLDINYIKLLEDNND